jgi:phage-related baseplate assembly protein
MDDSRHLSTVMTASLSAELEGKVPADLVADIVRAVEDESRRSAHDRGVEPTMAVARQRLERFIRARSFE